MRGPWISDKIIRGLKMNNKYKIVIVKMFTITKTANKNIELVNINSISYLRPMCKPFPKALDGIHCIRVVPGSCVFGDMSSDMSSDMSLDMSLDMPSDNKRRGCFKRPGRMNKNRVRFHIPAERARLISSESSSSFSELGDDFI